MRKVYGLSVGNQAFREAKNQPPPRSPISKATAPTETIGTAAVDVGTPESAAAPEEEADAAYPFSPVFEEFPPFDLGVLDEFFGSSDEAELFLEPEDVD